MFSVASSLYNRYISEAFQLPHPSSPGNRLASPAETRIYRHAALFVLLLVLSFIVPRFVSNQEGGFANAAGAVLVLLLMLVGVGIFSLFLFVRAARSFASLSVPARIAGIGPAIVMVVGLALLWGFLSY